MSLVPLRFTAASLIAAFALTTTALQAQTKDIEVTGQHRGYTNDQLFLRLDDDKEMTFTVQIPGDSAEQWHDTFKTLSRITVTYHDAPGAKHPIATAIRTAGAGGK